MVTTPRSVCSRSSIELVKRVAIVLISILLVPYLGSTGLRSSYAQAGAPSWPQEWQADSAFFGVWARADGPVAMQAAPRSWLWGPVPFAVANEPYAESATGKRLVEYLDKGRMEVNDPAGDRASPWFVTSGLLVSEMITGKVQTGNGSFETRAPADVTVAGDPNSPDAPTYASFAALTSPVPQATGDISRQLVKRDGTLQLLAGPGELVDQKVTRPGRYDEVSGHNIPAVFTEWVQQTGAVLQGGRLVKAQVIDPLFVLGRPVTEAYWADVQVAGTPARVLVQLFERRALTYNPANPPQWQVEMANVGLAYFAWRYGTTSPGPAISAEVAQGGVQLRGWNWPPGAQVSTRVDLAGAAEPLVSPQVVQADQAGRFGLVITMTAELEGALLSGADLRVTATAGNLETALPLAGKPPSGNLAIEGMITGVLGNPAATLLIRDLVGKEQKVSLGTRATINYSEGDTAPLSMLITGTYVRLEGSTRGSTLMADTVRLMSLSRTGASLEYQTMPGERTVQLGGTGWTGRATVTLTFRSNEGENTVQAATIRSDSRGNLIGSFSLPGIEVGNQPLWLFAQVIDSNSLVAQVAIPYEAPGLPPSSRRPPAVTAISSLGEQMGGMGSYCWRGACPRAVGVPLPGDALSVAPGEAVTLRPQVGPDPDAGISPLRMTAQLYAFPTAASPELTDIDGTLYFAPQSLPVMDSDEVEARPFSVALPSALTPGRYVLVLSVVWSGNPERPEEGTYGFTLEVPGLQAR